MREFHLEVVHRTRDPKLLEFLTTIRKEQPSREQVQDFFESRHLNKGLELAVATGLELQRRRGHHFMWLCVTNKGANEINSMALKYSKITDAQREHGYNGDANASAGKMFIRSGLWIRLTRNLDKVRGFVNGALAQVVTVLAEDHTGVNAFTARLSTGSMVLVHPIRVGRDLFLPCTYGYATTIRRAQGSSLYLGALYFDHSFPPEIGYGYVGIRGVHHKRFWWFRLSMLVLSDSRLHDETCYKLFKFRTGFRVYAETGQNVFKWVSIIKVARLHFVTA
jgi:hypothetical protein